ncbi:MAG TPA: hypothetical protein VFN49_06910 [Candidatus Aquilonibacter sp.]|nr:hypothetical protein [Candidatus Aquilonibacter sp.]
MSLDPFAEFEPFERREREVEIAARNIVAMARNDAFGRGWRPKGVDEVAILLESLGYSSDIVRELWYPDLFALARDVTVLIDKYVTDEERGEQRDTSWFVRTCRDYAVGSLYSGPWIIAVIGLVIFGASLWSSLSTPVELATAIALGVYAAQMISGFFAQAIARRLTFYFLAENAPLMRWTFDRFTGAALAVTVLGSLALWAALAIPYGARNAAVAAAFCAGTSIFQISLAPLYTMRRFVWIIAIAAFSTIVTGLTFALAFHRHVDVPWEPITLAAEIALIGLVVLAFTRIGLARNEKSSHGSLVPPSLRSMFRATLPYAIFGSLYFAAILCDRIFAGFAQGGSIFAYAARYELGADIALLAILPVTGVANVILEALPRRILSGSTGIVGEIDPFQRSITRFYVGGVLAIALAAIAAIVLGEVVGPMIIAANHLGAASSDALTVLRWATVGYSVVMIGLMNVQLLFFLSRPTWALVATIGAIAASAIWCTLTLLRHGDQTMMCGGLVVGSVLFAGITTIAAYRLMRRFTYAYYSAY